MKRRTALGLVQGRASDGELESRGPRPRGISQRRLRLAGVAVLLSLLTGSLIFATAAQAPAPETVEQGKKAFQQACGFCHGPDATGARGPDLVRSKLVAHDVDGNLIGEVIRNGRPDKGMPPLPLNDAQIKAIAAFLHARTRESLASAGLPKVYPVEKLLTGNVEAGKAYFNGAGGCKACHSPTGDLAGVARKYAPLDLEARMLYPPDVPSTVIVTLPSGQRVEGRLAHLDEFVVALRQPSGWYRSFPRAQVKFEVHDPRAAHRQLLDKLTLEDVHDLFAYLETLK